MRQQASGIGGLVGHSTNLVGARTDVLGSIAFNDEPRRLHISGVYEMNAPLFEMLDRAEDLPEAGHAFSVYMTAMFSIDAEQKERRTGRAGSARRFSASSRAGATTATARKAPC